MGFGHHLSPAPSHIPGQGLLDNGSHRRVLSHSRVIEVDPSTGEIVWQYRGLPMVSFFTHFTGGA